MSEAPTRNAMSPDGLVHFVHEYLPAHGTLRAYILTLCEHHINQGIWPSVNLELTQKSATCLNCYRK
jgi:hypothetical protein